MMKGSDDSIESIPFPRGCCSKPGPHCVPDKCVISKEGPNALWPPNFCCTHPGPNCIPDICIMKKDQFGLGPVDNPYECCSRPGPHCVPDLCFIQEQKDVDLIEKIPHPEWECCSRPGSGCLPDLC